MATVLTDWRTLPGIPQFVGVLVDDCVRREDNPEAHAAACAFLERYMRESNGDDNDPEPLGNYGEAVAAFLEGFEAAREKYGKA